MTRHWHNQSSTAAQHAAHLVIVLTIAFALTGSTTLAQAETYSVLYTFTGGPDGANPMGTLVRDGAGNLYGTTYTGGTASGCAPGTGCGTVFEFTKAGKLKVLYTFTGFNDGGNPTTGLVRDSADNLYGTADYSGQFLNGVAYKVPKTGGESVLWAFKGGPTDGGPHLSALSRDSSGNLYGTAQMGGANNVGAVFEISGPNSENLVYSFLHSPSDGGGPQGGVVRDGAGNFYGTTEFGGANGLGTAFKISKTGTEDWLYNFPGGSGEEIAFAGLIRDSKGNLYGTTFNGGPAGVGTVYELNKSGAQTSLFSFNFSDGATPYAGLVRDKAGNLYGTTVVGGASDQGTVFKIDSSGNETVLHSFTGTGGADPYAGLVLDSAGNLYGVTRDGGGSKACASGGCGVIFKITP